LKTLKQNLKLNKEQYSILKDYSHYSNNLYNASLFIVRQYFFETNKYIGYKKLYDEIKNNENYKLLSAQSSQQIIRLVDQNFRSFFALLRKKLTGQYNGKIHIPNYLSKGKCFNIIYTFQNSRVTKNKLSFDRSILYKKLNNNKLQIDFSYKIDGKIKQIMFKPDKEGRYFKMYINYEENKKEQIKLNKNNYLSIDLGINNFAACVDTLGHSFLMNGKPIKSYNRWYNKKVAEIKSELKKKNNKEWSNYLTKITTDKENWIDNYFNHVVNKLIKYCSRHDIGNIIIGYNEGWKTECNMGKNNNQKFYSIPYNLFKRKLENKCSSFLISFKDQEESYTSKCSFIDKESIEKQKNYIGKRIKRGLFSNSNNLYINSDINGAGNILRKVIGDAWISQPIVDLMLNPVKINFYEEIQVS
jgi:IS605 OrfB family transposase